MRSPWPPVFNVRSLPATRTAVRARSARPASPSQNIGGVLSVYCPVWAAYCRGTEDLVYAATVSVAPGSLLRGRRS